MWRNARTLPSRQKPTDPVISQLLTPYPHETKVAHHTTEPNHQALIGSINEGQSVSPVASSINNKLEVGKGSVKPVSKFLRLDDLLNENINVSKKTHIKPQDVIDPLYEVPNVNTSETPFYNKAPYPFQVIIQTTNTITDIAIALQEYFATLHIQSRVLTSVQTSKNILNDTPSSNSLYIFLYIAEMRILPIVTPFCVFNLAQQAYWPTTFPYCHHDKICINRIKMAMQRCGFILDYSSHNTQHYPPDLRDKVLHLPLPIGPRRQPNSEGMTNSVVFFGTPSKRRKEIITKLLDEYGIQVHVINDVKLITGNNLHQRLQHAKVILNLHLNESSVLETARINTCLRASNAYIISEECIDKPTQNIYKKSIEFVPTVSPDCDNISFLASKILLLLI